MNIKKAIYVVMGCISLGFGTIGTVLPVLPTVPFYLLAAFCFARSSERLHTWFVGTELYRKNLESYVNGKGMTKEAKRRIITTVSLIMAFSFGKMKNVPVGRMAVSVVWVLHVIYLYFGVKTYCETDTEI